MSTISFAIVMFSYMYIIINYENPLNELIMKLNAINWKQISPYILITILLFFLLFNCSGKSELSLINKELKTELKEYKVKEKEFIIKNKLLENKLVLLNKQKQIVKKEIITVIKKVEKKIIVAQSLSTKEIALYYTSRYTLPVVITKYGVSLSDDLAHKNIIELIERDGCFSQLKLTEKELVIEENKGIVKDTIINGLKDFNLAKDTLIDSQKQGIKDVTSLYKKEKTKKNIWKVLSVGLLVTSGYLFLAK